MLGLKEVYNVLAHNYDSKQDVVSALGQVKNARGPQKGGSSSLGLSEKVSLKSCQLS